MRKPRAHFYGKLGAIVRAFDKKYIGLSQEKIIFLTPLKISYLPEQRILQYDIVVAIKTPWCLNSGSIFYEAVYVRFNVKINTKRMSSLRISSDMINWF